jgi:putative glutamate/gamma-aminobutyrate antiporter
MVSKDTARVLTVFTLAMINVAAVANLGQLSILAEYGLSAIFFVGFSALVFFIPTALVSAELATGWPERGGVYLWVKEAFGQRFGFLAIWLQWIENVIWYPTILSFVAATIAFIINPALAQNPLYTFGMILVVTWAVTFANFRGMKLSGQISSYCVIAGTLFPAALVILLGLVWISTGGHTEISLTTEGMIPDLSNLSSLVFLTGIILGLAGIEMSAVHAREVKDPQRNYPKAIFLAAAIILLVTVVGSLAIAVVVPQAEIQLNAGVMEAFQAFFDAYKIDWLMPIIALLVAAGSVGMVSTWMVGPSKGLLAAATDGDLPPFFQKVNKNGMPTHLLVTQASIITLLALVFVFLPSINASYWILTNLTAQIYLVMYVLMFVSAIKLRYSKPNVKRTYRVPGMWIVAGLGILGCLFAFLIGFVPPSQLAVGNVAEYHGFLIGGILIACIAPFVIRHFKKPDWKMKKR